MLLTNKIKKNARMAATDATHVVAVSEDESVHFLGIEQLRRQCRFLGHRPSIHTHTHTYTYTRTGTHTYRLYLGRRGIRNGRRGIRFEGRNEVL